MATDFKYAAQTDLEMYYPSFSQFDSKRQIFGWTTTGTSNLYIARNSGLVTILFADGEDLGDPEANSGVVNANGEWYYDSALDTAYYTAGNLFEKKVTVGIENGDVIFRSGSRLSSSAIASKPPNGSSCAAT